MNKPTQAVAVISPPSKPALMGGGKIMPIIPQSLDEVWRVATVAFKGGICPKDCTSAENAMTRILHGLEVGLSPMQALQSIAVINGRPTIWGDGGIALIRASGLCKYIKEYEEVRDGVITAVCETLRTGETDPIIRTWSIIDERTAKLIDKDLHKMYPTRMRQMRARAFCLRDTYADVLKGLAFKEEVEDYPENSRNGGQEADMPPEVPPDAPPQLEAPVIDQKPAPEASPPEPTEGEYEEDAPSSDLPMDYDNGAPQRDPRDEEEVVWSDDIDPAMERDEGPPEEEEPPPPPVKKLAPKAAPAPAPKAKLMTTEETVAWKNMLENLFETADSVVGLGQIQATLMVPKKDAVTVMAYKDVEVKRDRAMARIEAAGSMPRKSNQPPKKLTPRPSSDDEDMPPDLGD